MERRASIAQSFTRRVLDGYWDEGGVIQLAGGELTRAEILARDEDRNPVLTGSAYVDELLGLMGVGLAPATRSTIVAHADSESVWDRWDAVLLIMLAPEMHIA